MKPITHHHLRLIDAAEAIRLDPDKTEAAFIARQLVQATLPHKNPGDVPLWKRTNGNLTLGIQPGMNVVTGKSYGYPYGTIPRLLLFWITTEAVNLNWVIASHSSCGNLALVLRLAEESAAMQNDCVTRWRDYSGQQEGA
jgi:hypothetical protein